MKTLHRILTPIISLLTIPAALFLPLFRMMLAQGSATDGTKINLLDNMGLGEYISIFDLVSVYKNGGAQGLSLISSIIEALTKNSEQKISDIIPSIHWGVIFLVFLVLCIVIALALAIVSIVTKRTGISVALSISGIVSAIIMNASFNAFAKPILAGVLDIGSLLSGGLGSSLGGLSSIISTLFGSVYSIDLMQLSIAYTAILFIFIVSAIFSTATSLSDNR